MKKPKKIIRDERHFRRFQFVSANLTRCLELIAKSWQRPASDAAYIFQYINDIADQRYSGWHAFEVIVEWAFRYRRTFPWLFVFVRRADR